MINIGLTGATGKMGTQIIKEINLNTNKYILAKALVTTSHSTTIELQQIAKEIINNINSLSNIDVIIDFSNPKLTLSILEYAIKNNIPVVIGTTGFSNVEQNLIREYAKDIPILLSPNMSLSVNLMFKLVELAATKLPLFETEIIEAHHRYKKDAPSGTAIKLGETIAKAKNLDFNTHAKFTRHGIREIRDPQDIGFSVIRGGDIVGEHEACFISDGEILSLKSSMNNRSSYARGALAAADFIVKQTPGLYSMLDVLQL